jgi:hypothetical protein
MEHASVPLAWWFLPYYCLLALSLAALVLPGEKDPADTLVVLLSALASVLALRNIMFFAIFAAPVAAARWSDFLSARARLPDILPGAPLKRYLAAAAAGILLLAVMPRLDRRSYFTPGTGDSFSGKGAADFLEARDREGLSGNLFNDFGLGGYLLWRLYPGRQDFADGRLVEFGIDFMKRAASYYDPAVWQEMEKRYGLTAAVIYNEKEYKAAYLDSRKDWRLVYWDDHALVYLKAVPGNARFIERYGYQYLRPNAPHQNYLASYPKDAVVRELRRSIAAAPVSAGPRAILAAVEEHM